MTAWLEAPPDLAGPYGHAWDLLDQQRAACPVQNPDDATLSWWIFHAVPTQHPAWEWYTISTVHLRNIEGQTRPPDLHFPAATHELLVLALNPEHLPVVAGRLPPWLEPPNACVQFPCAEDTNAISVTTDIATALCSGQLYVEEPGGNIITSALGADGRQARGRSRVWREIIDRTLEHIVTGGHA